MSRGNAQAAADAGRRMLDQAVEAGIRRAQGLNAKPSLKRYSWSRLHSDLLDDNRWALVALRAKAPLPIVEALVIRLEAHANRSQPRGYVGDFNVEGMAARWHVDADMVARIFAELERPDIGWIDQEQIVSFWDRNPDKVDETAGVRQQRVRDRKKGMRQLASMARRGLISDQLRLEREIALKDSKEPAILIASWPELSTPSRRDSVTVTTRAEQSIKQDGRQNAPPEIADPGKALQWLRGEGEAIVTRRLGVMRAQAGRTIERWATTLDGDMVELVAIIRATEASNAQGEAFGRLVADQIVRRKVDKNGPALPLPPVVVRRT